MTDMPVVVEDKRLDDTWAACARQILVTGEREKQFSAPHYWPGHARALFAFQHDDGGPDDAIGVLTYGVRDLNDRRVLQIDLLCVLPLHRRAGAAEALVNQAYALAVDQGCVEMDTLVRSYNFPMMRLIQKTGFDYEVVRVRRTVEENRGSDDWAFPASS